jgi:hypothetical protein
VDHGPVQGLADLAEKRVDLGQPADAGLLELDPDGPVGSRREIVWPTSRGKLMS